MQNHGSAKVGMGPEVVGRGWDFRIRIHSAVRDELLPGKVALQLRQLDRAAHGQDAGREPQDTLPARGQVGHLTKWFACGSAQRRALPKQPWAPVLCDSTRLVNIVMPAGRVFGVTRGDDRRNTYASYLAWRVQTRRGRAGAASDRTAKTNRATDPGTAGHWQAWQARHPRQATLAWEPAMLATDDHDRGRRSRPWLPRRALSISRPAWRPSPGATATSGLLTTCAPAPACPSPARHESGHGR